MGFVVTAYDLDTDDIAEALHTLANDIESEDVFVQTASDSITATTEGNENHPVEIGMELEFIITDEAGVNRLLDVDNIE